ncbi:phenylacetate--CoA ligase family protein [Bacillus sp. FJAT-49705]|uniref:Phenylacetate--CoA ligase family protein n=1 Tax=Cytobacillus citreus TaxID=2833586 RepID=A0ABS5NXN8_9BACI|nr:phenylacetate--CoA ligase family protein [Cytobacillus citreus]MBS4192610.1 phenylacetate--CoA ligase family protein [Cytobacillus citreus]
MQKYYDLSNMNFLELARNRAFFLADKIFRKGIAGNLKDIENKMERTASSQELHSILRHAAETVPYYKWIKGDINIRSFPVVNKAIIRGNPDVFISDDHDIDNLYSVTTSGSHGTSMKFYRTKEKKIRQIAEVLYFSKQTNFYFGVKHGFIRATHPKGKMSLALQNELHIDPTKINKEFLEKIRLQLKEMKVIIGFPSILYEIAHFCLKRGDSPSSFNLRGIITTAEPLLDYQRETIEGAFGCPVHTRYATEELGLVAVQNPHDLSYRVNEATFYLEILKLDSDDPCEEGEEGRIVVTDIYSFAMPLIRYDTGDLGCYKLVNKNGMKAKFLTYISGRLIEMSLTPEGEKISPFSINVKMKDVKNVKKYQFVQKTQKQYVMKLVVDENYQDNEKIKGILKRILGKNADISIEILDSIPTLPSGKTPYIINEYTKSSVKPEITIEGITPY